MSTRTICRYIFIATFSILVAMGHAPVYAQADTIAVDTASGKKIKKPDSASHQLCIGVDLVRPISNSVYTDRYGYEFEADYYLRNEFYLTAEGGWGGSKVDYTDLKYNTTNWFVRAGFNKSILSRDHPKDWDMMLMGLRLGFADVHRGDVTYMVLDSVWGNTPYQAVKSKSFPAVWAEVTGGMRVELVNGLFAGWNIRGKFIMNGKSFRDLAPLYICGFGKGDKTANFDFNLYISYGIRWKRAGQADKGKK